MFSVYFCVQPHLLTRMINTRYTYFLSKLTCLRLTRVGRLRTKSTLAVSCLQSYLHYHLSSDGTFRCLDVFIPYFTKYQSTLGYYILIFLR